MNSLTRDWFTHSATVPASARAQVNRRLNRYTATVRDSAHTHLGDGVSVCISGSLARGEPASRQRGNAATLASDVDLVAVIDHPDTDIEARVHKFVRAMLDHHPDIDTTAFTVHRSALRRVAGRFGADLHHSADRPLAGPAPSAVNAPRIGKREGLEGISHQLATIYCPDSPPGANPWRVKTALEALRAVAARDDIGPQRYSELPDNPVVCALFDHDTVAALVRAREHNHGQPISAEQSYELVVQAVCALFGVAPDQRQLIAALQISRDTTHLLDGFQRLVLAATIIEYGPPRLRCSAASALHTIAAAIDPATVITAQPALKSLLAISPVEFARGIAHPNQILRQHIGALRRDYYRWLGPHNAGAHPVTDYHGPTTIASPSRRPAHG